MKAPFQSHHFSEAVGEAFMPAGGHSFGTGFTIAWQKGPLGRGESRQRPNGAFVETIIAAALDRLAFYQSGRFNCEENANAIKHLQAALDVLDSRTKRRESDATEGTHEGK